MLTIPYRYLYPAALFFICVGVCSTNNDMVGVIQALVIGVVGYGVLRLGFHPAPAMLGFVLGPRLEENFRRAMTLSHGAASVFVTQPISAVFLTVSVLLLGGQLFVARRRGRPGSALAAEQKAVSLVD